MANFEYKTVFLTPEPKIKGLKLVGIEEEKFENELNKFAAEGWELISCVPIATGYGSTSGVISIFKRPASG